MNSKMIEPNHKDPISTWHPRVALDADGVLVSFLGGFEHAIERALGEQRTRQSLVWSLQQAYELSDDEYALTWEKFDSEHIYQFLPEMPGALEAVKLLKEHGFDVHVVSAIFPKYLEDRTANLIALGFDPDRKSTRLNSSHRCISYAVFCLK